MTNTPEAGWYDNPNPEQKGTVRYWNGETWTNQTHTKFDKKPKLGLFGSKAKTEILQLRGRVHQLEELVNKSGLADGLPVLEYLQKQETEAVQRRKEAEEAANTAQQHAEKVTAEANQHAQQAIQAANQQAQQAVQAAQKQAEHEINEAKREAVKAMTTNQKARTRLEKLVEKLEQQKTEIEKEIQTATDIKELQTVGLYDYEHPAETSADLSTDLALLQQRIKQMVRDKNAVTHSTTLSFEASPSKGKKLASGLSRVLLRAYNSEAENAVKKVTHTNAETLKERLTRTAEQIELAGDLVGIEITQEYQKLRLKEIDLAYKHKLALQYEKELEKERRAELREQRKIEQELKAAQAKLEKEKAHYETTLQTLQANGDTEGAARILEKLEDVKHAIEDVEYREANIRAGYVYVISNIGSFGENIVKIGLTRRLDPMDRIRELGDASVPFNFDVHALFFADDAVAIENMLHKEFADHRINQVNLRREYFNTTPAAVLEVLKKHRVEVLEFRVDAEAEEYRTSQTLRAQNNPTPAEKTANLELTDDVD